MCFSAEGMNNHIKMRTDLSGWGVDLQKLLLLLLATQDLAGQDPSMDPRGDSDGKKAWRNRSPCASYSSLTTSHYKTEASQTQINNMCFSVEGMNNHIKMRTDLSGWGADLQKLVLLLLATQDLVGQDPSMDPCGDSDGKKAWKNWSPCANSS